MAEDDRFAGVAPREIPAGTISRLPVYLRALRAMTARGVTIVSSSELAEDSGVSSPQLRKDLSHFGSYGVRGVGYDVARLAEAIGGHVGTDRSWPIVIVGMGNLGRALAANRRGGPHGNFELVGLVDADPNLIGTRVAGLEIEGPEALVRIVARAGRPIALLATPASVTQTVCETLIAAGVTSFLNFAPVVLNVPEGVQVRQVDLDSELLILAYHEGKRQEVVQ